MLKVGQEIDVVVLDINREKERVSLGLKQMPANPWDNIEERFPVGPKVKGKVINLVPYGAFVEIEPGVEGLIHVSELSWTKRIARPSDVLTVGQEIEAVVLGINSEEQKISLGVRQLETNPWDEIEQRYPIGTQVKGKVRNLTAYGAFVELEEGIDGMIHVSDMSWTRKINHPSEVLKKGDEVEAVVLEIDKANQRISLGIKQLENDPWKDIDTALQGRRPRQGQGHQARQLRRVRAACRTTSTASSTSRRSARTASTRSRTCSRSARKSKPASSRSTRPSAASVSPSRPRTTPRKTLKTEARRSTRCVPAKTWSASEQAFEVAAEEYRPGESKKKKSTEHRSRNLRVKFPILTMDKTEITAYLKTHCGWSNGVRAVLEKYDLPYTEKDIIQNPAFRWEMEQKSGQPLSPCVEVNGKMLADISGEELEGYLLERAMLVQR